MLWKVLVADDNLNVQRTVAAALKPEDIEVVAVSHGEAAVRKIPDVKPDLVLADVFMPVRTGYEVCEFVKNDPGLAHIPVLLLIGALEPMDQKEAGRVRADGYVRKPFEAAQLVSTVKGYLSKIPRKPTPEMEAAAQEFAAAIPAEEAPIEEFSTRPEPVHFEGPESEKPLAFGELLSEGAPAAEEEPVEPGGFGPPGFEGSALPAEFAPQGGAPLEPFVTEPAPTPDVFGEEPLVAELTPTEEAEAGPAPDFSAFQVGMEAPAEMAPEEPAFESAPTFEAPALEAAPSFEPAPAPPPIPEELAIEKEEQSWEIQAPISARDPMLADSVTDFMSAAPEVELPPMPSWEAPQMDALIEEAPAGEVMGMEEAAGAPGVDPALVEAVVEQVMERLTPQIIETVAREVVRPLAESLLKEKLEQQSQ